ncbi:hypothetical protein D9M71_248120 [compost metagenome]
MDLERLQIRRVAREHGDAHLHVALAAVLVEVGHESRCHRLENRWLLADGSGVHHGGGRLVLSAVHEVPGRAHGHTDRQQQGHHDQDDQLEFAFGCGVFYCCVALRHANNPSLFGVSQSHGKARASVMPERLEGWVGEYAARRTPQITVGAGLLAKAVYQSTLLLKLMTSSRASPLPQGFCFGRQA